MPSALKLRAQIETALSNRIPAALSPIRRPSPPLTQTGIEPVDQLLHGGLPEGAISELVGPVCSGRTTVALAFLAAVTKEGSVCAWIDASDALDPETAAANSVDLERLLWVRCGAASPQAPIALKVSATQTPLAAASQARHTGAGSPHPRSEGLNMPEAIQTLLKAHGGIYDGQLRREKKSIGTPGAPNRPLASRPKEREEQVNSDRLPPRRGDNLAIAPRCAELQPRRVASVPPGSLMPAAIASSVLHKSAGGCWQALDQAIRSADLLLQNGGFSAIVLDLGNTPPEMAWRIPLATWFRFRAACERSRTSLVLLTQHPCARSSAELVVRLETGEMESQGKVMTGIRYCAASERNRSYEATARIIPIRKPPQSAHLKHPGQWKSKVAWAQAQ